MKKLKKIYIIILAISLIIIAANSKVLAANMADSFSTVEYTEEFKEYLNLPDEEKAKIIMPKMYEFKQTNYEYQNPLKKLRILRSSLEPQYTLQDTIPNNMGVRNQYTTGICWAFASIASLETNLALNSKNTAKVYDFSERHMDYATTKIFANNAINNYGLNRIPASGGNWIASESYLTNGIGAVEESEMPFENNGNLLEISAIQNKNVTSRVYDTVGFSKNTEKSKLMNQIKEHIKNYGSVTTGIHGAQLNSDYYNPTTGAIYCDDKEKCKEDHAISIIGWDDNYNKENFNEKHRPTQNGAWKIKNSWGTGVRRKWLYVCFI